MESSLCNKQGTIQTKSDVLWTMQLARNISIDDDKYLLIPSFPLTTTMVKSNNQNKSYTTNACPPGPQATSTSVGESPDLLNLISRASSRAGKHVHPKGRSCARHTVRCSSRSVSAAEDSRKASPEPSSSSEESRGLASGVICVP